MTSAESSIIHRYQNADDKFFMSVDEAVTLSEELANRVRASGFSPARIIGIANGALLPATVVADALDAPLDMVRIRRKGSGIKKRLAKFALIRSVVSFLYKLPLTRPALRFVMDRFSQLEKTQPDASPDNTTAGNILIVDDAIESGQTIQHIIDQQLSGKKSAIHVAVISWSADYVDKKAQICPDSFISKRIHHYPWSQNSPHLDRYHRWLEDRGLEEWN